MKGKCITGKHRVKIKGETFDFVPNTKKRVLVLGTGLVGSFIANKLHEEGCEVATADLNYSEKLGKNICQYRINMSHSIELKQVLSKEKMVVNALPGSLGYKALETGIHHGANVVDISFMPEDFLQLNKLAKKQGVTAVCDFGFAPGISHMFAKKLELDGCMESCTIWVGGLPQKGDYKAPFSPRDVIEEYNRPARYVENEKIVTEKPFELLYQCEHISLPVGTYKAFISDGLRSLLKTSKVWNMEEYTIRPMNHLNEINTLIKNGFFKPEHIENTAKVLIEKWKMPEGMKDFSVLQVCGLSFGEPRTLSLYDKHDGKNHSMARVTGLPAVRMVLAILNGEYKRKGIIAPEQVAESSRMYDKIMEYLKENGVTIKEE